MKELIGKLLLKNRTIVSADITECVAVISEKYPLVVHEYNTGTEHQTWIVPPEWNVIKAALYLDDKVVASYDESPLFLAPYSIPFSGNISKQDLIDHTYTNPDRPDSFCYEFRLAYDYQRRLKEWRLALPHNRLKNLPEGNYKIDIDVEIKDGQLKIGEYSQLRDGAPNFFFLAHYCHPAQANDGLAGVVVMLETVKRIKEKYTNSRYSYKALVMPETIGSSIYATNNLSELDNAIGAVFSEMGGADQPFQLVFSRRGNTYIDRVFLYVLERSGKLPFRKVPFRKGWGNDELVFDSPGVNVPAVSLDRFPFDAYHTHQDDLSLVVIDKLEEMVDTLLQVVDVLENDYIPKATNRLPVYLSRFELYADWTYNRDQYDLNTLLMDSMWKGLSVLDIALTHDLNIEIVHNYYNNFLALNFLEQVTVSPEYSRNVLFLPHKYK